MKKFLSSLLIAAGLLSGPAIAQSTNPGTSPTSLAKGGTGASLTDPNADRILFWDDSAGSVDWLTVGSGLSITGTTISASGGAGTGDVSGPSSSTDNEVPRFDSTTGKIIQTSGVSIDDSKNLAPITNDVGALGTTSLKWADLFLASGAVVNFNNGDVTITHGTDLLTFAGAANGYSWDTKLFPTSNDGAALGDTTHNWSDLFLATGAVVNFNNGNYTLTHSSGLLTASGPFSVGTSNAITAGTIELGAASDTTLARVSAGTVSIEGSNILTAATGQPLDADLTAFALNAYAANATAAGYIDFPEDTDNGSNRVRLSGAQSTADVTVTLPAATDTLVGKATTDTFTNKTLDCGGTGNVCTVRIASDVSGLGTGVATFLGAPSSANLAAAVTDETGSGALVFGTAPQISTIELGAASDTTISRTGAGAIAVEGVGVALNSTSLAHTASQYEIGAASDTTLTRVSAGVAAIEGNTILTAATGQPLDGDLTAFAGNVYAANATAASYVDFWEDTDNGSNRVRLSGAQSTADVTVTLPAATTTLVGKDTTDTFTNKTFDADGTGNSITNIEDADIKSAAAIDASKIADGSVSSTEFQYLGSVTSDIQTQFSNKQPLDGDLTAIAALTTTAAGRSGLTITDPNADRVMAWDDSVGGIVPIALADIATEAAPAAGDYVLIYDSGGNLEKVDFGDFASGSVDAADVTFTPAGNISATDVQAAIAELDTEKQPVDSDLTDIAGLTATTNNIIQSVSSAWASRTPAQVTATLPAFVGDSGSGGTKGLVPAPATGDATKYLKGDGTWDAPAGSGTVTSVVCGDGLSGGTITASGTCALDITGQTDLTTPALDDRLIVSDTSASGAFKDTSVEGILDATLAASAPTGFASGDKFPCFQSGVLKICDFDDLPGASSGIANVVEDTTPQLGGDLDLNSHDVTGTGNIDVTGNVIASGYGAFNGGAMPVTFADAGVYVGIETNGNANMSIVSAGTYGYFDIGGVDPNDYQMRFLVETATGNTTLTANGTLDFSSATVSTSADLTVGDDLTVTDDVFLGSGAIIDWASSDLTLTHSANTLTLAGGSLVLPSAGLTVGASIPFSDSAGTLTLQNVDALDATTESTVEAAIDTLANLVSVQGLTVTLADAGADALLGWDDSASAYQNLSAADARAALGLATSDSPQFTALNVGDVSDTTVTRGSAGHLAVEGATIWDSGNDGSGSGLDADTLDGTSSAGFQTADADLTAFAGNAYAANSSQASYIDLWEDTDNGSNRVRLSGAQSTADVTVTLPAATDTLVGKATTDVFTNKTLDCGGTGNVCTVGVASDVSGLGTGVATFLGTPSSANLASAVTDETGSGALVFGTAPQISTIELGNASDTTVARGSAGHMSVEGQTVWDAANDGSGSGLDADLLDGKNTGTSGNTIPLLDGGNAWSGLNTYSASMVLGDTAKRTLGNAVAGSFEQFGTDAATGTAVIGMFNATAGTQADIQLYRSKNAAVNTATVVASGDGLGKITWYGAQQTSTLATVSSAAQIRAEVDGTVTSGASGDMPGRIIFATTADGSGTLTDRLILDAAGVLKPNANDGVPLGTGSLAFSDLFLASGGVINFNNGNATLTHSAGLITSNVAFSVGTSNAITAGTIELGAASDTTIARSGAGAITVEGVGVALNSTSLAHTASQYEIGAASDTSLTRVSAGVAAIEGQTIDTASNTLTLTNKRITPRIGTTASSATPTPDGDNNDEFTVTALAAGATFAAPTGTPTDGQKLVIRIKDNGSAQTLAWNAIYRAGTDVALPTTTVISKTMYLGFIYNAADSKWDLVALVNNI